MILEVARHHIKVRMNGKTVTVKGEMFNPSDEKLGFAIDVASITHWDAPNARIEINPPEVLSILQEISADFVRGGHTLEID